MLRDARRLFDLPIGCRVAISRDGRSIAGFASTKALAFYTSTGAAVARWDVPELCPIAFGEDGSRIAIQTRSALEVWSVPGRELLASVPTTAERYPLTYAGGHFYGRRDVWRADDLAHAALERSTIPTPNPAYAVACGSRFLVSIAPAGLVLWDRTRVRSILHHPLHDAGLVHVTPDGRIALTFDDREGLVAFDLVRNAVHRALRLEFGRPDFFAITDPSARLMIAACGVVMRAFVFALDWDPPPDADPDPLATAWDHRPAPIVEMFEHRIDRDTEWMRTIARRHPALEIALAPHLAPVDGMRWARRALRDPAIAARADAWRRLAEAALAAGDRDAAADACAEGLGRDQHDEALYALLARSRAM